MDFVEELRWRGMLHDFVPGTEDYLKEGMAIGYIGFDPTSDSLGVGNLVQIMTLLHFQRCGHKPIVLVGGATGMVGDPSFKNAERSLLSEDTLAHNLACVKAQLEKFLDFSDASNGAIMVNNHDWFKTFDFLGFIRDVGKHITVNYMMSKDSVKSRLDSGLSFTEFSYQLIQGYDFVHLMKNFNCRLQMGGSDQWGNITTGTELIRRLEGGQAFALTTPLITKADGTKFGKTESGNVWLDPAKTSPYQFYQFWLNSADADAGKYLKIFSTRSKEEIYSIIEQHEAAPHERLLQKTLAEDITSRVHGEEALAMAQSMTKVLFGMKYEELQLQNEATLKAVADELQCPAIPQSVIQDFKLLDLVVDYAGLLESKSEARKMIKNNGLSIGGRKITSDQELFNPETDSLLDGKFVFLAKGKTRKILRIE